MLVSREQSNDGYNCQSANCKLRMTSSLKIQKEKKQTIETCNQRREREIKAFMRN